MLEAKRTKGLDAVHHLHRVQAYTETGVSTRVKGANPEHYMTSM